MRVHRGLRHRLVPLIAEVVGIPLAVFPNPLPKGREIVFLPQPVQPHRLFAPNPPQGGVLVGGVGVQFIMVLIDTPDAAAKSRIDSIPALSIARASRFLLIRIFCLHSFLFCGILCVRTLTV